jgi:hypothetical protein
MNVLNKQERIYYCPNCQTMVALNVHGRCERCQCDNVVFDTGTNPNYWSKVRDAKEEM